MGEAAASEYAGFVVEIKARIRRGQYQALRAANEELLDLYWDIGESIHVKQETFGWGKAVVETLARDLQADFPGRNGFSAQNLWLMRQFYLEYRDLPKLQPMVREISWTKNLVIFARCKDVYRRSNIESPHPDPFSHEREHPGYLKYAQCGLKRNWHLYRHKQIFVHVGPPG